MTLLYGNVPAHTSSIATQFLKHNGVSVRKLSDCDQEIPRHTLYTNPCHRKEESHNSHKTSGRQPKMIAKLERMLSTTSQNKDQTQKSHKL